MKNNDLLNELLKEINNKIQENQKRDFEMEFNSDDEKIYQLGIKQGLEIANNQLSDIKQIICEKIMKGEK